MLSTMFNDWAIKHMKTFKHADKKKRIAMIKQLQMDIRYLQSDLNSYKEILNDMKDMEEWYETI